MSIQKFCKNLTIVPETDFENLVSALAEHGIRGGHFTNGTYAPSAQLILPTVLAAFQYAVDNEDNKNTPLIIAINSNESMAKIMEQKIAEEWPTKEVFEDDFLRADKVAVPLALQHPDRKVAVVFYDEETPNNLYRLLKETGFRFQMNSLFKWGFGTDPKAGIIEGAENFGVVRAHPLPNDIKPVCDELTRRTGQKGAVQIVDLRTAVGPHGAPYITPADDKGLSKCLFPLAAGNAAYGTAPSGAKQESPAAFKRPPRLG